MFYDLIVFLPLLGFLIAGLFGRQIGARNSELVTTGLLGFCAFLSWIAFFTVGFGGQEHAEIVPVANWFISGKLSVPWSLRIDTLTAVMLVVVNTVSFLVHLYSIGYMAEDPSRPRFFAYLSLFTFSMLMLVTADNLVQMFFGWEGVGLMSYLLIGFWYEKPSANAAAIKAFVVNRVGDFGFSLGIFLVFQLTGSVSFEQVFAAAPGLAGQSYHLWGLDADKLTFACLLLFMGAMGKSAQFLLHTWLPDAMEGPTPVSALIHAATMVTAGVFMVARLSPLFDLAPTALSVVTIVGATTAMFAATVGLVQNDIKKVIAYSTCSQLGYMFVGLGVGGYGTRDFPSLHSRLLQGSAVPRRGLRHHRDASRAGHAGDGRVEKRNAVHLLDDGGRHAGAHGRRHSVRPDRLRRRYFEGCDHRGGLRLARLRLGLRLPLRRRSRRADVVLLLAPDVHDLLRPSRRLVGLLARRRARPGRSRARQSRAWRPPPGARIAQCDAGPARRARVRRDVCRHAVPALVHRQRLRGFLEGLAVRRADQQDPGTDGNGSLARFAVPDPDDARWAAGRLLHVCRRQDGAGALGRGQSAALPLPPQQVVFRRALRLPVRAAGVLDRAAVLEGRRRFHHRRVWGPTASLRVCST